MMPNQPDEQASLESISHAVDVYAAAIGGCSSFETDRAKAAIMDVIESRQPLDLDQVVAKLNCLVSKPKQVARPRGKRWRSGQGFA